MNLRQLKYFLCVVDTGNMTRAAEQLNVAQTALGMQIRQLEEALGVTLLVRHSRGVEPTAAGRILRKRADAILGLVEETRSEIATYRSPEIEAVCLGITPALMLIIGPEIAMTMRERVPKVKLRMIEAMSHVLVGTLMRGEADYILCYDVPDHPQFVRTPVLQDDLVLVTVPDGATGQPVTFAEVLQRELAMPEKGDTVRTAAEEAARALGQQLRIAHEVRSISAMKSLVARGAAVSILPYFAVIDEVADGKLDARRIVSPSIRRTLYLTNSRERTPVANAAAVTAAIQSSLTLVVEALGSLAHRV